MLPMTSERWQSLQQGIDCPFCEPRANENKYWSKVATLSVATLYLQKAQTYRGYCLLIFDSRHATRPSQLDENEWSSFCSDLYLAQQAIESVTKPDHMNVAALGNQISHLHWHIIPRYEGDSRWGGPIWTTTEKEMEIIELDAEEHQALAVSIRQELQRAGKLPATAHTKTS